MFSLGVNRMSHTAVQPSVEVNNRSVEKKKKNNSPPHQQQKTKIISYLYQDETHLASNLNKFVNEI